MYNRGNMIIPAQMTARVVVAVRENRCNHQLAHDLGSWLRAVADGDREEMAPGHNVPSPDSNEQWDAPLIISHSRIHKPRDGSADKGFPAGRTECGLLLGSSTGLNKYELVFTPQEVEGKQVCGTCIK